MKSFSSVFSWRNRACQLEVWAHCEYGGHIYSDFTSCRWLRVEAYELTKKVLLRLDIPGDLNLGKMMAVEMEKKGCRSLAGPKNKGQSSGCAEMVRVRACVCDDEVLPGNIWQLNSPVSHIRGRRRASQLGTTRCRLPANFQVPWTMLLTCDVIMSLAIPFPCSRHRVRYSVDISYIFSFTDHNYETVINLLFRDE